MQFSKTLAIAGFIAAAIAAPFASPIKDATVSLPPEVQALTAKIMEMIDVARTRAHDISFVSGGDFEVARGPPIAPWRLFGSRRCPVPMVPRCGWAPDLYLPHVLCKRASSKEVCTVVSGPGAVLSPVSSPAPLPEIALGGLWATDNKTTVATKEGPAAEVAVDAVKGSGLPFHDVAPTPRVERVTTVTVSPAPTRVQDVGEETTDESMGPRQLIIPPVLPPGPLVPSSEQAVEVFANHGV